MKIRKSPLPVLSVPFMGLVVTGLFISLSTNAALIDRGGGFIYDDVQDITWTQDANINGQDTWDNQGIWADSLSLFDSVRNVTWDDWRLPTTLQPDASCVSQNDPGGGLPLQGSGTGCTGSEMGHLFNVDSISASSPGLFTNVVSNAYWSGTEFAPVPTSAWVFGLGNGSQAATSKDGALFALAVRSGDVGVVPIPASVWLFGSALGLLGWIRRKTA